MFFTQPSKMGKFQFCHNAPLNPIKKSGNTTTDQSVRHYRSERNITMKIHNDSLGVKIQFRGFRGDRPSSAVFSVEKFEGGVFGVSGLVGVPLTARPRSRSAARRAKSWAKRRVLESLEVAA